MNDGPTLRVHIAPLGAEKDRITEPAIENRADKVILLDFTTLSDRSRHDLTELHGEVETTLREAGIDVERRNVRVDNIMDAAGAVAEAAEDHLDDWVQVNLASGDKITAIGGMIGAMAADAGDGGLVPYYVEAEQHDSLHPRPAQDVKQKKNIPPYNIDRPDDQHLVVMDYIARSERRSNVTEASGPYRIKTNLYKFGDEAGLPFMDGIDLDERPSESDKKAAFGRLQSHVIEPLLDAGYIREEEVGTKKPVFLTDQGERILEAFRYRVQDGDDGAG